MCVYRRVVFVLLRIIVGRYIMVCYFSCRGLVGGFVDLRWVSGVFLFSVGGWDGRFKWFWRG